MRASGYMITYDDANYMIEFEGFTLLGTLTGGNRALTSSVITAYMNADSSLYSAYASNRLVPYQLLEPAVDCTLPIISVETYTLPTIPTTPSISAFTNSTTSGYRVNFTSATDDSGILRYEVSKNGDTTVISTGLNLFYDNTDSAGITANWKVRAIGNDNSIGEWSTLGYWATVPMAPVLDYVSTSGTTVNLERNTVTGGSSYWLTTSDSTTAYYVVSGTSFTTNSLNSGSNTFRIQAKGAFGLFSAYSNPITDVIGTSLTRNITNGVGASYYGYIDSSFGDSFGSIDNNDISSIAGAGAIINMAYGGGTAYVEEIIIYVLNGSNIAPSGFSSVTIGGTTYTQASSFTWNNFTAGNGWEYRWRNKAVNGFGTTTGAVIEITFSS